MKKYLYLLSVIRAGVAEGLEVNPEDSLMIIYQQAWDYIMEYEPYGIEFVQTDFSASGHTQSYIFLDEETGYNNLVSGDIFDFCCKSDSVFFKKEAGQMLPVKWFDVPGEGDPHRKEYVFVFAKEVLSNGKIAYLYDHFE